MRGAPLERLTSHRPNGICSTVRGCRMRLAPRTARPGFSRMDLSEIPSQPFRRHPWEEARFRFVDRVLRGAGLDASTARILDAGAGDGWLAAQLIGRMALGTEIVCWDPG